MILQEYKDNDVIEESRLQWNHVITNGFSMLPLLVLIVFHLSKVLSDDLVSVEPTRDVCLVRQFAVYHRSAWCRRGVAPIQRHPGTLCLLVSVLCGDIHTNPGPVRYPCGICKRSVATTHKGLLCDLCNSWFHIVCVNVTVDVYESFRRKNDFDWQCPACLFSHLPLLDIVNDNDLLSEGSGVNCESPVDSLPLPIDAFQPASTGLRVVHQNVQGLSSKMPEIAEWLHEGLHLPLFCVVVKHGFHVLTSFPLWMGLPCTVPHL